MPRSTKNQAPPPGEPGTTEAVPVPNETIEAAALNASAAENQIDSPEATATSPGTPDDSANPNFPEPTTDANPSLSESGTAEPTSPQDETPEPEATKDVAGAGSEVSAAPSSTPEENLALTNEGYAKQPSVPEDGGWFVPFVPPASKPRATKPAPKPQPSTIPALLDKILRDMGIPSTPADTLPNGASQTPAAADRGSDPEMAPPTEVLLEPEVPLPPPRVAAAVDLVPWIEQVILARTHLSEDETTLAASWALSTWFPEAHTIYPCLVITGPAHRAREVLSVLQPLCYQSKLLAGFRRSDLGILRCFRTILLCEPNLDKRTANLLSGLTDERFFIVEGLSVACYSKSIAIYAGEDPETYGIQNSLHLHLAPTSAEPAASSDRIHEMREYLPVHLQLYRDKFEYHVRHWTWTPSGLSSEMATMAEALGRGIVDAPQLRQRLLGLLKTQDQQRRTEMSNTRQAVVLEATLTLSRDGRELAYAGEIAAKANQLLEARGETARLSPEKVGHSLKKLGLPTLELSQDGNGLTYDSTTLAKLQQLAATYGMEVP